MKFSEGLRKGLAIREKLGRPYCAAVIVAAGSSSRMGGTNKILTVLEKLPVICRTVDAFDRCSLIDEIIVVTQKDLMEKVSRYLAAYGKMRMVVAGGETRTDSVMAGLAAVSDKAQLVAVHDGARPLVTDEVIRAAVVKARKFAAAAPAVRVKDTIKVSTDGAVDATPDRSTLYAAQTPQAFRRELYASCMEKLGSRAEELTDDSALLELCGEPVHITPVTACNMKVTRPEDLAIAEAVLRR